MSSPTQVVHIPEFLFAGYAITRQLEFDLDGVKMAGISPLAQGYGLIADSTRYSVPELVRYLEALLRSDKTVVIQGLSGEATKSVFDVCSSIGGVHFVEVFNGVPFERMPGVLSKVAESYRDSIIFLVTNRFILRRFFHGRVQERNPIYGGQRRSAIQAVRFVGLAPSAPMLTRSTISLLERARHTVLFDRTRQNILKEFTMAGDVYVLRFVYEDFAPNLLSLNLMLASLQAAGVLEVDVLIEGNPEIYDYAEGLSTVGRRFSFEVSTPLVVIGCRWLERTYGLNFIDPSYVLTSGFNLRQGITTKEVMAELDEYVETDMTFMVMEMYCGDLSLVLGRIGKSSRPKCVFVLTNMFSDEQKVYFLRHDQTHLVDFVLRIRGRFTTLVVVDEGRVTTQPSAMAAVVREFGVRANGS